MPSSNARTSTFDPFAVPPFPANCQITICFTFGMRSTDDFPRIGYGFGFKCGRHARNPLGKARKPYCPESPSLYMYLIADL